MTTKEEIRSRLPDYLRSIGINPDRHFKCLNPSHKEKTGSMKYYKKKHIVRCFGCGTNYDIFDLIGLKYKLNNFKDQFSKACEIFNINNFNVKKTVKNKPVEVNVEMKKVIDYTEYFMKCTESVNETNYFKERGLSAGTIQHFNLGYDPNIKYSGLNCKGVIIPTAKDSYVIRNIENKGKNDKIRKMGSSNLFNVEALQNKEYCFIVEGEFDAMSIVEVGFNSIGLGGIGNLNKLIEVIDVIKPQCTFIISLDNDEAGKKATLQLEEQFKYLKIPFIIENISKDHKDANEALINDREGFKSKIIEVIHIASKYENEKYFNQIFFKFEPEFNVVNNSLQLVKQEKNKNIIFIELCNFISYITLIETLDDNQETKLLYHIEGINKSGKHLKKLIVNSEEFSSLNWINKSSWAVDAIINPGRLNKDYIYKALQITGQKAPRQYKYSHTGWIKINNKWVYLHNKGAVGEPELIVELDSSLKQYTLIPPKDQLKAIEMAKKLLKVAPNRISIPLMALTFLSPLNEFLSQRECTPKLYLFLKGESGAGKSSIASIYLNFFGADFNNNSFPAGFSDTVTAIEKKGSVIKDALFVVDDFHPRGTNELNKMTAIFEALTAQYGDRKARDRCNNKAELKYSIPPMGNLLITGETYPKVSQSRLARGFFIDTNKGDINFNQLQAIQENKSLLSEVMYLYINSIRQDIDPIALEKKFYEYRKIFLNNEYARIAEINAFLLIGYSTFIKFLEKYEAINQQEANKMLNEAINELNKAGIKQNTILEGEKPAIIFLKTFISLKESGQIKILDEKSTEDQPLNFCGYEKKDIYAIVFESVFEKICKFRQNIDSPFPVDIKTLEDNLSKLGILEPKKQIRFGGKTKRFHSMNKAAIQLILGEEEEYGEPMTKEEEKLFVEQLSLSSSKVVSMNRDSIKP